MPLSLEMVMFDLESLGWDAPRQEYFESRYAEDHSSAPLRPARVVGAARGEYFVIGVGTPAWAQCTGALRHGATGPQDLPAVGDWVVVRDVPGLPIICAVLPRRTQLTRKSSGRTSQAQVLAANVDHVLVVTAVGRDFNPRRLERYLAAVAGSGAEAVVVVNKCDLPHDAQSTKEQAVASVRKAPVVYCSAQTGDGVSDLQPYLRPGGTIVLVGSSGVGKSTLANRILGQQAQDTQEVRAADSKGRHTTTRRDLLIAPSGVAVVDTPGIRELGLWVDAADVDQAFDDISALTSGCRFGDCQHEDEPGCAVLEAVERGELDPARLRSYGKLQREAARVEGNVAAAREKHEKWKTLTKSMRKRRKLNRKLGLE